MTDEAILCSFCGKTDREVDKLIAGPQVTICDECVDLCNDIIADDEDGSTDAPGELPPALRPGDLIRVCAPAGAFYRDELEVGIDRLESRGYRVKFDERILERDGYLAGPDSFRADDLKAALENPDVRAVFVARGGYGASRLLDHLNRSTWSAQDSDDFRVFEAPFDHPGGPKILVGYSDITFLLAALQGRPSKTVFHGPQVAVDLGRDPDEETLDSLLDTLEGKAFPGMFQRKRLDALVPGVAEGPLAGGCLSILVAGLGTPTAVRTDGAILFFEDIKEPAYRIDRMLTQLRLSGKLDRIAGVVIGYLKDVTAPPDGTLRELLLDRLGDLGVPVAMGLESGHGRPCRTLPLGARARLDADAGTLEILEPVVAV